MAHHDHSFASRSIRAHLPRLSITAQMYLGVLALALALLFVEGVAWLDTERNARAQAEAEIEDGLDSFQSDFNRATRELIALGEWLIAQKTFGDMVQARETLGLNKYLEPWISVNLADTILVSDREGVVLARVGDYALAPRGVLEVPATTIGKRFAGLAQDHAGRLMGRVVLPIVANDTGQPLGNLLLGFYLDGYFLQYRFRKLNQEIAIVYDDKLYIITLTNARGLVWGGNLAPTGIRQAQRENRASGLVALQTDVGEYWFKFKPFQSAMSVPGMYGVGVSVNSITQLHTNLFRTFATGIIVIALGMGLGAFFFSRFLTRPLRDLSRAAQAMARGDLATPIHLARNDELGDLARDLDHTRDQLRQAMETATLEHNRYAGVIQSMGVAAIISDQHLRIVAVNEAAESLLKQKQATLIGQWWHHVFGNDVRADMPPTGLWALGEPDPTNNHSLIVRGRFPLRARPQTKLDVISTAVELGGKPVGFVHILQDATAQEQLVRAKDEFIMNAAHEFRGPLASLRASIELLVEDYTTMSKQDLGVMLRSMQRAVVKFQGLVENLIDVGNIQAGRFRVRPVPVRLASLIADALDQVAPLLQGRAQTANVAMNGLSDVTVAADRARITQVLINLITNASKYSPEGEPITIAVEDVMGVVTIRVTDRGPGIHPEEQTQLFQRFYRGRRAEEEGIGIGLGLALAREIIQAHGGQIGVQSQVGAGTTFWFSLPCVESSEREGQRRDESAVSRR